MLHKKTKHYFFSAISNIVSAIILISIVIATYLIAYHRISYLAKLRSLSLVEAYDKQTERLATSFSIVDFFTNKSKTHLIVYNYGFRKIGISKVLVDNSTASFLILNPITGNEVRAMEKGLYEVIIFGVPSTRLVLILDNGVVYEVNV